MFIAGNRITMLDVSEPNSPRDVGEYSRRGGHDLCVDGEFVYVASGIKGLLILQFDQEN